MSRKSTGIFQQKELREKLRRLERELAELKAVSNRSKAAEEADRKPPSSEPLADAGGDAAKPKSS